MKPTIRRHITIAVPTTRGYKIWRGEYRTCTHTGLPYVALIDHVATVPDGDRKTITQQHATTTYPAYCP